jgi:hypothetical protein
MSMSEIKEEFLHYFWSPFKNKPKEKKAHRVNGSDMTTIPVKN